MISEPHLSVAVIATEREGHSQLSELITRAARREARLVVLPFGVPAEGGAQALAALAKEHAVFLVGGWVEGRKRLAGVFSPEGTQLGSHAQTHTLPGEAWERGDCLAPVETPLGRIGLSIGSEIYFPEIHWSLVQQGADLLIHLEGESPVYDHFYSTISPRARALDLVRPLLIARPTSQFIKLVHNEEMGIAGTPMSGSEVIDQNGAVLASTGFSRGMAQADLRLAQHCRSAEMAANVPMRNGNEIWRLYFNDSRRKYFTPLCQPWTAPEKPAYAKRKIRIAVVTNFHGTQLATDGDKLLDLVREACRHQPDIVVMTEMEGITLPEKKAVKENVERLVEATRAAGSYLLIGGMRYTCPEFFDEPYGTPIRTSHGQLWDRSGEPVFLSRIMLYGKGCGQEVYDTDFGRIGIRLCGDIYAPELDRLFALAGADIVLNPSMSWGASGRINTELNQARAMDNGHFIVSAHLAFSDAGQRSHVIDPMGGVVAASAYYSESVLLSDIDLDAPRGFFVEAGEREIPAGSYLEGYRTRRTHRLLPHRELFALRRPELYTALAVDRPDHPYTTRDRGDGVVLFKPTSL